MYWVIRAARFLAEKGDIEVLRGAVRMLVRAAVIGIVGADCAAEFGQRFLCCGARLTRAVISLPLGVGGRFPYAVRFRGSEFLV